MKIAILPALLLASVCALWSCKEDPYLNLDSQTSFNIPSSGGSAELAFSTNQSWTVSSSALWCKPAAFQGAPGKITMLLECAASGELDARRCIVTVSTASGSLEVTVNQSQKDVIITSSDSVSLPFSESRFTIDTQSNVPVNVIIAEGDSWLTYFPTKAVNFDKAVFMASSNSTLEPRSAVIRFEGEGVSSEVTVKQEGYYHPVLDLEGPGLMGIEGVQAAYRPGSDQTAVIKDSGKTVFRFLRPSEKLAFELGGIPSGLNVGDTFTGSLSIVSSGQMVYSKFIDLLVIKTSGTLVWLSAGEGAGLAVKI